MEGKKEIQHFTVTITDRPEGVLRKCFMLFKTCKYTNNVLTSEIVNTKFFEVTSN